MIESTADFVGQVTRKPRGKREKPLSSMEIAVDDARRRAASGEWDNARGTTFVGLYAMCHRMVYGVLPAELAEVATFRIATKMAARALHEFFADDPYKMVDFMRWSWEREKRKNNWAQSSGHDRTRMMWRWQFARSMETDYRIARSQRRG